MSLTSIDLCCGAGGLTLGLEVVGIKSTLLVDSDKDCIRTLQHNGYRQALRADIADLDYTQYRPDILVAGFPCQPFSSAGTRQGLEDTRSNAFYQVLRAIKESKPRLWLLENVAGLATHNKGQTLKIILETLYCLGGSPFLYYVNVVDYRVPQYRKRVIICSHPLRLNPSSSVLTLQDALKDCPQSLGMQYSEAKRKVLEQVPMGGNWRSLPPEVAKEYMGKMYYSTGGRTGVARRLHWDKPAPTIPCSPAQKQTELCHPEKTRPLKIRECARVQTFPDDYEFIGSIASQYKQIGNAVPVILGKALGEAIVETLG